VALVARYFDIHPVNPQPRLIEQVVALLRDDGVIAYPTDSGYALGIQLGNRAGLDRMRAIRNLDDKHHFTLLCHDFAQMGPLVHLDNAVFRTVKAATPGPYTFILPATSEVPRRLMAPKKRTVGVRIPDHVLAHALLEALGEPLISTTLLLPGQTEPMTEGWSVKDQLDQLLDAVIEGEAGSLPTTVVDISSGAPEISRYGAGDASRFE
jgi:tRNA threonylcarbamoyl adenosine modification protein (Sua5/YciO/YrdC/YwlC family)